MKIDEIYNGVWKVTFGETEKVTPVSVSQHSAKKEKINDMVSNCFPFDKEKISFRIVDTGCVVSLPLLAGEGIYGFGLQLKSFNQIGKKKHIRTNADPQTDCGDSHAPVPFYVSTSGYGVLVDTARYASFYCGSSKKKGQSKNTASARRDHIVFTEEDLYGIVEPTENREMLIDIPTAKGVDIYIFEGPDMKNAVSRYNLFSGGGFLPPMWGLGVAYRAFAGYNCAEWIELAKMLRADNIPCNIFGLEPGWQSYSYSCSFKWDEIRGENHEEFLEKMKELNFKVDVWEHAFVHPTAPFYDKIEPFCCDYEVWSGIVPDFIDEDGKKIFADYHEKELIDKGISAFKLDECDGSDNTHGWSFPNFAKFPSGVDGEQMHSLFGVLYQNTLNDIFVKRNQRSFNSVRNSHALAAPLPFVLYSDLYDHTEYIRGMANVGFSGLLWSPEFRRAVTVEDFVRRVQTSMFAAYSCVDQWSMPNPPWFQIDREKNRAGIELENGEQIKQICRDLFSLRMSFLPYLYAAFAKYNKEGVPPFRALVMDYPEDEMVKKIDNQYFMGDSVLIAPLTANDSGKRKIYLPKGNWYDFWTGKKFQSSTYLLEYELDKIPLFIKENTLLPLAKPVMHVEDSTVFEITVRAYGENPVPFRLYEDDFVTYNYQNGEQNEISLSFENDELKASKSGNFQGEKYKICGVTKII